METIFFIVVRKIVLNLITLRLSKHNKNRKKGIIIVFLSNFRKNYRFGIFKQ